jgi:hypothetical protein
VADRRGPGPSRLGGCPDRPAAHNSHQEAQNRHLWRFLALQGLGTSRESGRPASARNALRAYPESAVDARRCPAVSPMQRPTTRENAADFRRRLGIAPVACDNGLGWLCGTTRQTARQEKQSMGFCAETIANVEAARDRQARRDMWICNRGLHVVTIVAWRYEPARVGRNVVFEVHDDAGRRQFLRFNLTTRALRDGELLRFVVAAMNWRPELHAGDMFSIAHRKYYEQLIGRRIAVVVMRNKRGLHDVVDWEATAQ